MPQKKDPDERTQRKRIRIENSHRFGLVDPSHISNAELDPGGVFLVCLAPNSSVAPAGAWFYTAANLFTDDRKPFFPKIILIVPPGTGKLNYRDRVKDAIAHSFEISVKNHQVKWLVTLTPMIGPGFKATPISF